MFSVDSGLSYSQVSIFKSDVTDLKAFYRPEQLFVLDCGYLNPQNLLLLGLFSYTIYRHVKSDDHSF